MAEAMCRTSWQAPDLHPAAQPNTVAAKDYDKQVWYFPPYEAVELFNCVAETPAHRTAVRWRFPPSPKADATGGVDGGSSSSGGTGSDELSAALGELSAALGVMAEPLGVLPRANVMACVVARAARKVREARRAPGGVLAWVACSTSGCGRRFKGAARVCRWGSSPRGYFTAQ